MILPIPWTISSACNVLSEIFLLAMKSVWWGDISLEETLAILSAKIFVSNLYIRFTQEIGLKSDSFVVVDFLEMGG